MPLDNVKWHFFWLFEPGFNLGYFLYNFMKTWYHYICISSVSPTNFIVNTRRPPRPELIETSYTGTFRFVTSVIVIDTSMTYFITKLFQFFSKMNQFIADLKPEFGENYQARSIVIDYSHFYNGIDRLEHRIIKFTFSVTWSCVAR